MSNSSNQNNNTAVVDAVSGVIGSLLAMITFYPLDVLKTNIQASSSSSSSLPSPQNKITKQQHTSILSKLKKQFQGMNYKIVNTVISNYIFFWVFSWLQYRHKRRHYYLNNTNNIGTTTTTNDYHLSVLSRLGLSSLAAILNIFVTLPLDVLSTRRQIAHDDDIDDGTVSNKGITTTITLTNNDAVSQRNKVLMDEVFYDCNDDHHEEEKKDDNVLQHDQPPPSFPLQKKHHNQQNQAIPNVSNHIPRHINQTSHDLKIKKRSTIENILSLWSGIGPSIILCSNPAIHYTFYDVMKLYVLQQKKNSFHERKLSMNEAFCIGFLAKLLATIVTYPFIRTKVILMAGKHNNTNGTSSNKQLSNTNNRIQKYNEILIQSIPFLRILSNIYKEDGVMNGLYKGCMLQIIHTALKSAVVMMMKERVSAKVQSILG